MSTRLLNTSRDGDTTTALGSPFQCPKTPSGKKYFLICQSKKYFLISSHPHDGAEHKGESSGSMAMNQLVLVGSGTAHISSLPFALSWSSPAQGCQRHAQLSVPQETPFPKSISSLSCP